MGWPSCPLYVSQSSPPSSLILQFCLHFLSSSPFTGGEFNCLRRRHWRDPGSKVGTQGPPECPHHSPQAVLYLFPGAVFLQVCEPWGPGTRGSEPGLGHSGTFSICRSLWGNQHTLGLKAPRRSLDNGSYHWALFHLKSFKCGYFCVTVATLSHRSKERVV